MRFAGNFNLDGPIYIDLEQHTAPNGGKVWQIKDIYYGECRPGMATAVHCMWPESACKYSFFLYRRRQVPDLRQATARTQT